MISARRIATILVTLIFIACFIAIEVFLFTTILNKISKYDQAPIAYMNLFLTVISILIITILYKYNGYDNDIILINSAIASPIAWSWIFKPLFNKIGIGYNKNKK